jgi:glutathione reductase (NADPH)
MSGTYDYDVVVLGGGSGGLAAAFRAARHGARVAMLEPGELGGTCVNVGCVPKKAMWLAADLAGKIEQANALGFEVEPHPALDWDTLIAHRQGYIANIHASYRKRLDADGISVLPRRGRLRDAHTVVCSDGVAISAQHIVIATGAHPMRPSFEGAALGSISDDFFKLRAAPERAAVVGGGYIAIELAGLLQALGSHVEMFVKGRRLLERFDAELAAQLAESLHQQGVRVHFEYRARRIEQAGDGRLRLLGTGETNDAAFEQIFLAIGRRANTKGMGLEDVGVRLGDKDEVLVDEWQTSSVPNIHAVGDVAGKVGLTPVAIAAARKLMDRLFGGKPEAKLDYENVPTVVFSHPPLGMVGLSEEDARARHGDAVSVYRSHFRPMLNALADSPQRSLFKLVCVGEEQRVVGIHLLGEGADEILQGFAVALKMGVTLQQLEDTVAIHPTSAEEVVLIR